MCSRSEARAPRKARAPRTVKCLLCPRCMMQMGFFMNACGSQRYVLPLLVPHASILQW